MVEQRRSIRWASHGARRMQVGRKFSWATPGDQKKRCGSRIVVTSSWARVASIKNTESEYSWMKRWKWKIVKKRNRSAKEWLPPRSNAINEGLNWPVFTSPAQGNTDAVHRKNVQTRWESQWQKKLRSSRVISTLSLELLMSLKVTTLESMQWRNPSNVVSGWNSGWWFKKTLWRAVQNSKKYPKSKPLSDLRVGKINDLTML